MQSPDKPRFVFSFYSLPHHTSGCSRKAEDGLFSFLANNVHVVRHVRVRKAKNAGPKK
jgi:hypothetical protein